MISIESTTTSSTGCFLARPCLRLPRPPPSQGFDQAMVISQSNSIHTVNTHSLNSLAPTRPNCSPQGAKKIPSRSSTFFRMEVVSSEGTRSSWKPRWGKGLLWSGRTFVLIGFHKSVQGQVHEPLSHSKTSSTTSKIIKCGNLSTHDRTSLTGRYVLPSPDPVTCLKHAPYDQLRTSHSSFSIL